MAHEISWAQSAVDGVIDAVEFIARDSPSYAAALAVRAERAAASPENFPNRGRRVGEFNDPAVRELSVGSYRLIYRVRSSSVLILAFGHQARDLGVLRDEPDEPAQ